MDLKVALCTIYNDNILDIKEWVEWNKNIGISKIFIYENNINNKKYESIKDYISGCFVEIINIKSINDEINDLKSNCFIDFYEGQGKDYDWICFLDINDFLMFNDNLDLFSFLNKKEFINQDLILVSLKNHNHFVKSIVRSGRQILDKSQDNLSSVFRLENDNTIYSAGLRLKDKINHYDIPNKIHRLASCYIDNRYQVEIKENELKVALCAIAKNENLYIREWVEWYKNLGISKIFLYDNNEIDGERFEEVINDYIESGFVEVIDVRGVHKSLEKKYAEKTKYHGTQQDCYEHCFQKNKYKYDWILFCDIDEFLVCNNLNLYLNKHLNNNTDVILLNWITYGDNEELIYSNKPLKNRFKYKSELRQYNQVKSFVNCKINKKMLQIDAHLALFENAIYRDAEFNLISPEYKKEIILGNCYIKHYLTKSCEEWILRKYHNTSATGKDYFNKAIDKRIKEFFTFNTDTTEKRNIINRTMKLMDNVNSEIVVSFTSFGDRLYNDAPITIQSILNQTVKPNKICLTLFNEDIKYIPNEIQKLINENIVDLIISDKNLKPHLKYFYVMQKYRDCIIITIDDDHIYENNMIENLLKTYKKYPTCIVARRCHLIQRYENGDLQPYKKWKFEYSEQLTPGQNLFATGVGGVLYPPDIFELSDDNLDDIYKCLNADDIYLKWLEVNKHINVVWSPNTSYCGITIQSESAKNNRLQDTNWKGTGNDDYLKIFKI